MSDSFTLLASFAVAESKDEEVAELLLRLQAIEGSGDSKLLAEVAPDTKDFVGRFSSFGSVGSGGDLERRAKISLEAMALGRCSSCHGLDCG